MIDYLYSFPPLHKDAPAGDVIFDAAGNIYGVTATGGVTVASMAGCGMVYELTPIGGGGWHETTLYAFQGGTDGAYPTGVTFDSAGNLVGTAVQGGTNDVGVIFQLTPSGDGWTESVLYNFDCNGDGGCVPQAGLMSDASGNLYGSTVETPSPTYSGTIFEFSPSNGGLDVHRDRPDTATVWLRTERPADHGRRGKSLWHDWHQGFEPDSGGGFQIDARRQRVDV